MINWREVEEDFHKQMVAGLIDICQLPTPEKVKFQLYVEKTLPYQKEYNRQMDCLAEFFWCYKKPTYAGCHQIYHKIERWGA